MAERLDHDDAMEPAVQRHTHATLLGRARVSSKVVQQCMGHKTHAITIDLHTHVFAEAHSEAAETFDRLLRKA